MTLLEQRKSIARQLYYIDRIKRLQGKFRTWQGYMYCIADELYYMRRLTEINEEMERLR